MKHCPNPSCPHRRRVRSAAEFLDQVTTCSDCGAPLEAGSEPASEGLARDDSPRAAPRALWIRLAVTLLAPLLILLGERITLPGVDLEQIRSASRIGEVYFEFTGSAAHLSVLALGITPLISAYLIVEIAALVIPRWQPLRHGGPEGRAKLERSALLLALCLAIIQAHSTAQSAQAWLSIGGLTDLLMMMGTLVAGMFALILLAQRVGRSGLVNGLALITVFALVYRQILELLIRVDPSGPYEPLLPLQMAWLAIAYALIIGATLLVLGVRWDALARRRSERSADPEPTAIEVSQAGLGYRTIPRMRVVGEPRLPLPASGVAPLSAGAQLITFPAVLALYGIPGAAFLAGALDSSWFLPVNLVLIAGLGVFFAVLFNDPKRVAAVWARARADRDARADHEARAEIEAKVRAQLRPAILRSVGFLVATTLIAHVTHHYCDHSPDVLTIALATGIALDIRGEWRARLRAGELVAVWVEHRPYALDVALGALAKANIPAHPRGAHQRALLQFFGPHVPIELMVAPADVKPAQRILRRLLLDRSGKKTPNSAVA